MSYFGVSLRNGIGLGLGTVPSLSNTPLAYRLAPTLTLSFAGATALDPRITFTRASSATFTNSAGLVALSPINLLTYSEQFDNAAWTLNGATVTANTAVAPDGATTGDTLSANGVSTQHTALQTSAAGSAKTFSVYIKSSTNSFAQLFFDGDTAPWASFDISVGTVGSSGTNQTASIQSVGNGWYRCVIYTASLTASNPRVGIVSSATSGRAEVNTLSTSIYIWGAQLQTGSTATTYIPTVATATGAARFDYDPVTLQPKGLLIEEARTNLLTYSEQFDNAAWAKNATTITANAVLAPDGTLTADKLVENTANSTHSTSQTKTITGGLSHSISTYVKVGERTRTVFGSWDGTTGMECVFNLATGIVDSVGSYASATMAAVGNGWYRCIATRTTAVAATTLEVVIYLDNGTSGAASLTYIGNGTSGIYLWGAQLEAGAFATSYIPTVAAQATRAAENAVMTGTNFSSWYNATEGTLFAEAKNTGTAANWYAQMSTDSNFNNRIVLASSGTNFIVSDSLASNQALLGNYDNSNTLVKAAGAYAVNNFAYTQNGLSALSSASGNLGTPTLMTIGYRNPSTPVGYINGHIKRITYWPRRLSNAELQAVTS